MGKSYGMILYLVPSIKGIPLGLKRNFFYVMHGPINQNPQGNLFLKCCMYDNLSGGCMYLFKMSWQAGRHRLYHTCTIQLCISSIHFTHK